MTDRHEDGFIESFLKKSTPWERELLAELSEEDYHEFLAWMREAWVIERRARFRVIEGGEG